MIGTLAAYLHQIDPYMIELWQGGPIRWYGVSYLIGFLIGYLLIRRVTRVGVSSLSDKNIGDLAVAIALGIVVGGRLGYVLFYRLELLWQFTPDIPFWGVLAINEGGMASHGGMIGGILATGWFARKHGHPWLHLLDLMAFAAPLGVFFGRIANFINGELLGRPCSPQFPLAVRFPQELYDWPIDKLAQINSATQSVPALRHAADWDTPSQVRRIIELIQQGQPEVIAAIEPLLTPRHPSQLYAALLEGLLLFTVLAAVWTRKRKPGTIAGCFCLVYGVVRIGGEFFRVPDAHLGLQWLGLTRGQWLSVGLVGLGIAILITAARRATAPMGGWLPDPAN